MVINCSKRLNVILICGLQMFFITKPVTTNLSTFIEKYRQKTLCLVCRKIILGSDKKGK